MEQCYPQGPAVVPENFTTPTAQYKRHAWLAMASLCLFAALYMALAGWFVYKAYRMFSGVVTGGDGAFLGVVFGLPAAFLAVFMLKALFFVKHSGTVTDLEITPAQQPRLFEFLYRLADEAGAPRPHRVFISPRVNASVFYDLSLINLLFASRKNLEIGLGLVSVLDLGQLKAVLAHEFGHFAQRTMAVGRWVYIAQQIADHIVSKRDALDRVLHGITRIDLRVAWIGWLLQLIVWSIRSLLEQLFRVVMMAQRALSREMEMQADLVSVSLTGSDALIDALHVAQAADEAWDQAIAFVNREHRKGHLTVDLFAVQTRLIDHLRRLFADADFGRTPASTGERQRVFRAELAQPPRMWLTHPPNHEREENAKRVYLSAPADPRSAWTLFEAPEALRCEVTRRMFKDSEATPWTIDQTLAALDTEFAIESLHARYRGVYLGRSPVRAAATASELIDAGAAGSPADLERLYPESLTRDLEQLRNLLNEIRMLEHVRDGRMTATGGIVRYRDTEVRRRDLPATIARLKGEASALEQQVALHDRHCRSVHRAAAAALGGGWDTYHAGLLETLHYADHALADLQDAQRFLANEFAIVTADGRISKAEWQRLLRAADVVYTPLAQMFEQRLAVQPGATLLSRMEVQSFTELLEEFTLGPPTKENISGWLNVIDGWITVACHALGGLRYAALEQLLETETRVARATIDGVVLDAAPEPAKVPAAYPRLLPGTERKQQTRLDWWGRFQTADGVVPGAARLLVAGSIVTAVVGFGGVVGNATVMLHNGLNIPVNVTVAGRRTRVEPQATASIELPPALLHVETRTERGDLIESFDEKVHTPFIKIVYNVAQAAPLIEWTVAYGARDPVPRRKLGAPRWTVTTADILFTEPPKTISTSGSGGTRRVLSGFGDLTPRSAFTLINDGPDRAALVRAHARWDGSDSPNILDWLAIAARDPEFSRIVAARLAESPHDVVVMRAEQDGAGDGREHICRRHLQLARDAAQEPGLQYLAARCQADSEEQNRAFLEGHQRWPQDPWWAYAAGLVQIGNAQWDAAAQSLTLALKHGALADHVALELARIMRLVHPDDQTHLARLQAVSPQLRWMVEQEREGPYARLHQAQLGAALARQGNVTEDKRLLRLTAASEGAGATIMTQALMLPSDQGVDTGTIGAAIGLAMREKADVKELHAQIDRCVGRDGAAFRAFIQAVTKRNRSAADGALRGVDSLTRGQAYVIGILVLGTDAPAEWRRAAHALLFGPERPYFE